MKALRLWPFRRIVLVSGAWCLVIAAGWLYFDFRASFLGDPEGAGIGAVSIGFSPIAFLASIVPPAVLIAAWRIMRWVKSD